MKVLSIHVGMPRDILRRDASENGETFSTGIFKEEVFGGVRVNRLNIDGDGQADLKVHGGEHKAVYSYASQYYRWWRKELGRGDLTPGIFGENLVIEDMDEAACFVGDHYRIGSVILEAAQPRLPCFKLAIRMNDPSIVKRFLDSGFWGIYYRVVQEGVIKPGDLVEKVFEHPARIPVRDIYSLTREATPDQAKVEALLGIATLCPKIRAKLETRRRAGPSRP